MTIGEFPSNAPTKLCTTCGALMPNSAIKCTKCDSFQNWHNRIAVSTTVLALLTALVSVAGATLPNLWSWYRSGNSHVSVSFAHDDDEGGIFLVATNDGDRIGSIARVSVDFTAKDTPYSFAAVLDPQSSPSIEPGKSQKIRYTIDVGTDLIPYSVNDVKGDCSLHIEVREFSGARTSNISRKCSDLRPLDFGTK
ncbi:hypothetical protein LUI11_32240 [Bradyrhizobium diazoefficiens]|nr:hypothetical protein [Bradyrhizobium diazoefficiens]APO49698.1 hypothetical protein BD122_05666 [Bradyrhizobium diazoefficiens]MCD9296226.1 hypothetical protein [Bradyrhizobium diazoefficiens]MCD9813034.1 hypothetical protein [Bradyrhizobium diazoefficiens]MCD9831759.1 hypothetical protein [Bradyrhizobium diazoefficiens]MCD9849843.1 hypothetical protein [Bradyrhizobium diazoefficiens]